MHSSKQFSNLFCIPELPFANVNILKGCIFKKLNETS
jgi:hypothetical protein